MCNGVITRSAAEWDYPLTLLAPASCISCHYKAHLANLTARPNESHCKGTFLHALLAEALCIMASYTTTGPSSKQAGPSKAGTTSPGNKSETLPLEQAPAQEGIPTLPPGLDGIPP